MDPTGVVFGAVGLVMAGLVAYWVTRAAGSGDIEVNAAIGIRTRLTTSSQQAWEAAHRAALPFTMAACVLAFTVAVLSTVAAVLAETAGGSRAGPGVVVVGGYVGFLVVMMLATRAGNAAVRSLSQN